MLCKVWGIDVNVHTAFDGSSLFCMGKMGVHTAKEGIDVEELYRIQYGE